MVAALTPSVFMGLQSCHVVSHHEKNEDWAVTGEPPARARALRRARAAAAPAEAERQARQRRVEAALAAYFEAADGARRIREAARAKAEKILDAAEDAAAGHDASACEAIGRLRALGEVNARIAALCGISVPAVRAMAARARSAPGASPAGDGTGCPGSQEAPDSRGTTDRGRSTAAYEHGNGVRAVPDHGARGGAGARDDPGPEHPASPLAPGVPGAGERNRE
jgi:hypothetical protein